MYHVYYLLSVLFIIVYCVLHDEPYGWKIWWDES